MEKEEIEPYETEASENEGSETSLDSDCACGDPACEGCIVGAMRSDKAKSSFVAKAKKAYSKAKGM